MWFYVWFKLLPTHPVLNCAGDRVTLLNVSAGCHSVRQLRHPWKATTDNYES